MIFHRIAIAATFDHLHNGHKKFLDDAFKRGEKVIIGLTSDTMAKKKFSMRNEQCAMDNVRWTTNSQLQNFQTRKENLEKYLEENNLLNRTSIVEIDDIYGPAVDSKSDIEALVVTQDTLNGARLVNKKRKEIHVPPLKIITVTFKLAQDRRRISSTRIRNGELNREGKIYKKLLKFNSPAGGPIPESLRQKLKSPQGELIRGDSNDLKIAGKKLSGVILGNPAVGGVTPESVLNTDSGRASLARMTSSTSQLIISIGDEVTKLANYLKLPISISIIDFKVNRKIRYSRIEEHGFKSDFTEKGKILMVRNPPGCIRESLVDAIYTSIKMFLEKGEKSIIRVHGEEDLAGLPAILLAPLGSIILYGQPGEGIVLTQVTEDLKDRLITFIVNI